MTFKIVASLIALVLMSGSASALTIINKGATAKTVAIDFGHDKKIEKIAAGNFVKIDGCKDTCSVSGPWGFAHTAKTGDTIVFDEKGLKPSYRSPE
jgi:hypothetical protein